MGRIGKTVFNSYRRANSPLAVAISQSLTHSGFDVFLDYQNIGSGDFERVILENIRARAHFLAVLTPSSLTDCDNPGDWLRREIEEALETRRNIVPLMLEGFNFDTPAIASKLMGKLTELKHYDSMIISGEYFEASMARLYQKFLNMPVKVILHQASEMSQRAAKNQQSAVAAAPPVQVRELTAQDWFERGFNTVDLVQRIRCFSEAIRIDHNYIDAYIARGKLRGSRERLGWGYTGLHRSNPAQV